MSAAARAREIQRLFRDWNEHIGGVDPAVAAAENVLARQIRNRDCFRAEHAHLRDLTRTARAQWREERKKLRERTRAVHQHIDPLTIQTLSELVNDVQIYPRQLPADPNDLGLPPDSNLHLENGPWLYVQTRPIDVRGAGLLVTRYAIALRLPQCNPMRLWRLDGDTSFAHPNCPTQGGSTCLRDFVPLLNAAYRDRDLVKLITLLIGILSEGTLDSYMYQYFHDRWTRAKKERNLESHTR